MIFSLDMFC